LHCCKEEEEEEIMGLDRELISTSTTCPRNCAQRNIYRRSIDDGQVMRKDEESMCEFVVLR